MHARAVVERRCFSNRRVAIEVQVDLGYLGRTQRQFPRKVNSIQKLFNSIQFAPPSIERTYRPTDTGCHTHTHHTQPHTPNHTTTHNHTHTPTHTHTHTLSNCAQRQPTACACLEASRTRHVDPTDERLDIVILDWKCFALETA